MERGEGDERGGEGRGEGREGERGEERKGEGRGGEVGGRGGANGIRTSRDWHSTNSAGQLSWLKAN